MPNVFVPQKLFPQHITGFSSSCNYYENGGQTLQDAADMRKFSETHAPGLFDVLLSSILRDYSRLFEERKTLQEQRTVALLHIKTNFRIRPDVVYYSSNRRVELTNIYGRSRGLSPLLSYQ